MEGTINKTLKACLTCALLLGFSLPAAARQSSKRDVKTDPSIPLLVFDYAKLPDWLLRRALDNAQEILRDAGVAVVPALCTQKRAPAVCHHAGDPLFIDLRLVLKPVPGPYFHALGYAAPSFITVNFPRVEEVAARTGIPLDRILGCVMAHELGHALLGPNSHAEEGLMTGLWSSDELAQIDDMFIRFNAAEKKLIRSTAFAEEKKAAGQGISFGALNLK